MNKILSFTFALCTLTLADEALEASRDRDESLSHTSAIHSVNLSRSVVSASGFEQDYTLAPASISVITPQEIQTRPVRDLAEALSNVPGVSIDSDVSKTGGYGISIRGMGSSYTLILVDGKRINSDSSLFPNRFGDSITSFMPPLSAIERIEVIRGPASTLYGSDAIGGVVNIVTKKSFGEWGASFGYDYTMQQEKHFGNTQGFNFFGAGALNAAKNLGLMLRGRVYTRDFVSNNNLRVVPTSNGTNNTAKRNEIVGLAPMQTYNIGARLLYNSKEGINNTPRDHIYLDIDYAQQDYDNSQSLLGTYSTTETDENARRGANGYGPEMHFYRLNTILAHKGNYLHSPNVLLQSLQTDTSLQYNITTNPDRFVPNATFANAANSANGVNRGDSRELSNEDIIFDIKSRAYLNFTPSFGLNATLGARYWYNRFKDKLFQAAGNSATQDQHIGALFAEGEFGLFDRAFLTLGIRGNYNSIFGSNASPRAYFAYDVIDSYLVFKGGISTGYKTPALSNLVDGVANLSAQGKSHTYGNPNLKPEQSINYEASLLSDNEYFSASLTGFYIDFTDKIATSPIVSTSQAIGAYTCSATMGCNSYINYDKAKSYGTEVAFSIKPISVGYGGVSLNAAYTYNQTKVTKTLPTPRSASTIGTRLTNIPLHNLNASLNYDTFKFGAYIREEFKDGIYRGDPNVANSAAAVLGEFYKPIYLTHIGGYYKFKENLKLNLAIYNLLNLDFVDYQVYSNAQNQIAYANNYNYIREGRRYYFSMQMDF